MGLSTPFAWPATLSRIAAGDELSTDEAAAAMGEIMAGEASQAQIGAFLLGMRIKGETIDEMTGLVTAMLQAAEKVSIDEPLLDTCGTGGDRHGTINVSTCAAFVAAGAGARVAKHGNRAASSQCGSADLLEAMGVEIDLGPPGVARCIDEAGVGFFFARRYHPAMRYVAGPRQELGVPTVMNFLGPLANPARARHQALGVSRPEMAEKMVGVLDALDCEHALVFHGEDGLDELSITGSSTIYELSAGLTRIYEVSPESFGLEPAPLDSIRGGDAATNLRINDAVLAGEAGPARDVVLLNAAAAIVAADLATDIEAAVPIAAESIDSGAAARCASRLVEVSQAAKADYP